MTEPITPSPITPSLAIRLARPVTDLDAQEDFYVGGLGLDRLLRITGDPARGERDLLMVGPAGGPWHLELTASDADPVPPTPTPEDLLVVYLGRPVPAEAVARAVRHGGRVVASHNPYWDEGGVTLCDPDGYRVVLTGRTWSPAPAGPR